MRSYRIDLFGPRTPTAKLRLFGPDGNAIGERPFEAAAATQFATKVAGNYAAVAPNLQAIGRKLYAWLDGSADRWLSQLKGGPEGLGGRFRSHDPGRGPLDYRRPRPRHGDRRGASPGTRRRHLLA